MSMQQCPNGHLYDDSKNSSCPYCSGSNQSLNVTMPLDGTAGEAAMPFPQTTPMDNIPNPQQYTPPQPHIAAAAEPAPTPQEIPPTAPVGTPFAATTYRDDVVNDRGIVEIRGWLVCLEGKKRGVDFKIYGEKNTIGRGSENDIKLDFDRTISQGVNAIIAYDNRNNKFYLYQSNSKNNIYFNNQLLLNPVEMKDYDILEIGETKMIFRSLCNEEFNWGRPEKN